MGHYDFILFENYHVAFNHKEDVKIIAKMLTGGGLKVAILDLYGEDKQDEIDDIQVLHLPFTRNIPNDKWNNNPRGKLYTLFALIRFWWQQHWYMKAVGEYIYDKADQFYIGSYFPRITSYFMSFDKPCYYWGLRSHSMTHFWTHFKKNPLDAFHMIFLKHKFLKNPSQKLFVSNEFIKNEFIKLGIPRRRIVIREERYIDQDTDDYERGLNTKFNFLTIGKLREDKQIEKTIAAFNQTGLTNCELRLVGASFTKYESKIKPLIERSHNIIRVNRFLDYTDFNNYFRESHFVVFADKQGNSCITNGTMLEALINHRPIIAPNYPPYNYYIDKYNIGILYDSKDETSFINALNLAHEEGCKKFFPYIKKFLRTIEFYNLSKELTAAVKNTQ